MHFKNQGSVIGCYSLNNINGIDKTYHGAEDKYCFAFKTNEMVCVGGDGNAYESYIDKEMKHNTFAKFLLYIPTFLTHHWPGCTLQSISNSIETFNNVWILIIILLSILKKFC